MDVINAAKKISEAGTKFNKLAIKISEKCPESTMKKDMLAYMQQIPLYCHQLNITSKVKEGVQSASGNTTKEVSFYMKVKREEGALSIRGKFLENQLFRSMLSIKYLHFAVLFH